MSNKAAPHRKFVQTFVLAEQPNGYFVLNDIFRYINEDEEEEPENESFVENNNTAESAPELEPEVITKSNDSGEGEDNPSQIRKDNEDEASDEDFTEEKPAPDDSVPQGPAALEAAELVQAEDAPAAAITVSENEDLSLQENAEDTSTISEIQPEIPKDPEPTPVASPPMATKHAPIPAQPVVIPNKPAARKTWANLVAEKPTAAPAVSSQGQSSSMSPAPIQSKTNPSSTNRSLTPPTSSSDDTQGQALQSSNAGWQMAGQENGKRQNRQQSVSGSFQKENVLGYIKNVTDRVDASLLKTTLLQYGKLVYFDVSRPKVL